jgi:hypothetical protein
VWPLAACAGIVTLLCPQTGCKRQAPESRRSSSPPPAAIQPAVPIPPGFPTEVPLYPGAEYRSTSREGRNIKLVLSTADAVDAVDAWYRARPPFSENTDGLFGSGSGGFFSVGQTRFLMLQDPLARNLLVEITPRDNRTEITLQMQQGAGCPNAEAKVQASGDCQDIIDPPPETIADTKVALPASAKHYREHTMAFQDQTTWVRFEMAPSDLPSLEARLPCRLDPPSSGEDIRMGTDTRHWYTPNASKRHRRCEYREPGRRQAFLIDLTDEAQPIVYVVSDIH